MLYKSLKHLGIVLPVYNEADGLEKLLFQLEAAVSIPVTLIVVNDGSTDCSYDVMVNYKSTKKTTSKRIVNLSRNFGHQQAIMAGIHAVPDKCDSVVVMDADFQDIPADVVRLLDKLEDGYDCVYGERKANSGNLLVNFLTSLFYNVQSRIVPFNIPQYAGTFCAFRKNVLRAIQCFSESENYFPGIRAYVGFRQIGIPLTRGLRVHGKSKIGFIGLIRLSVTGVLGFSAIPMKLIFLCGLNMIILCFLLAVLILGMKILRITQIPGITTTLLVLLGGFGIQFMFMGIIGEYIGKLFIQSKKRPIWLVREVIDDK